MTSALFRGREYVLKQSSMEGLIDGQIGMQKADKVRKEKD
jgi:hypothetical protein